MTGDDIPGSARSVRSDPATAAAPARRGRSPVGAVALAVAGGLLAAGGSTADWLRRDVTREVGGSAGLVVEEVVATPGTELVPVLLPVGVALVLAGLLLLVVRGGGRRAGGLLVGLVGVAVLVLAAVGALAAGSRPGVLGPGPGIAAGGGLLGIAGGVLAGRRPATRPALPSRYSIDDTEVEEEVAAGEWRRASVEPGHTPPAES